MTLKVRVLLYALFLAGAITLVYIPGLTGGFLFDDYPHIVDNQALKITEWSAEDIKRASLSSQAGPFKRPVAMFTFAVNHLTAGLNPQTYLITNLYIHILNALLLAWLSFLLLRAIQPQDRSPGDPRPLLLTAFAIAVMWGLHPYNLTSVNYIIQRMTSLSALFSLVALICFVYFRQSFQAKKQILLAFGMCLATLLAILSKENALLLPVQIAIIELTLFTQLRGPFRHWITIRQAVSWGLIIGIPGFFAYHLLSTDWASAYHFRHYSLSERWLTEQRVLWTYLQQIFLPNITTMGLFLDDYPISNSLTNPITTLAAIFGHAVLLLLAFLKLRKYPVLSFSIFWFYASHLLESTIFPLEIMFEHRNYTAAIGPLFGLVYYLTFSFQTSRLRKLSLALLIGLTLLFSASTSVRASYFGDWLLYPIYEAEHHPTSSRANFNAGRVLAILMDRERNPQRKEQYFEYALKYFKRASSDIFQSIEPINGEVLLYLLANKPIPPALLQELEKRLRYSSPGNNGFYIFKSLLSIAQQGVPDRVKVHQIESLFASALNNPKMAGQNRGFALINFGIFKCNIMNDCTQAARLAKEAVETNPGYLEFKVILASFLFNSGNKREGTHWLNVAKDEDTFGYYAETIRFMTQGARIYWGTEHKKLQSD
jgi:hypothetical protein